MNTPQSNSATSPDQILANTGAGFAIGSIGGTVVHYLNGFRTSPGARFVGGAQAVSMNMPRTAASWAAWCGVYSSLGCAFSYARQKDDPWNTILAGAATSGLFSMRQGIVPMGKAALGGALLFAFIEGVNLIVDMPVIRAQQQQQQQQQQQIMPPPVIKEAPMPAQITPQKPAVQKPAAPSAFSSFLRKKKEEVKSYMKDTVSEGLDAPNFDFN